MAEDESTSTVLVAGAANLLIAAAKLVAGLVSGSSAMLSEAAHSFGDTMNQVFLMAALRKSRKPPDAGTRSATAWSATSGRCWRRWGSSSSERGSRRTRGSGADHPR